MPERRIDPKEVVPVTADYSKTKSRTSDYSIKEEAGGVIMATKSDTRCARADIAVTHIHKGMGRYRTRGDAAVVLERLLSKGEVKRTTAGVYVIPEGLDFDAEWQKWRDGDDTGIL